MKTSAIFWAAVGLLIILLTVQVAWSFQRFNDIVANQQKILVQYEEIKRIDLERVAQNNHTEAALRRLIADDMTFNAQCLTSLKEHVSETKK